MAYDEEIAFRIRQNLIPISDNIVEKKMFGGLTFLYKGKMSVGIVGHQLAVRVVSEKFQNTLGKEHVREMDFTGKALKDFIYVDAPAFSSEFELNQWIDLGLEHAKHTLGEI